MRQSVTAMNLSYVRKLLVAANPFIAVRTNFRRWSERLHAKRGKKQQRKPLRGRHLTVAQREDISTELQDSTIGPISMTATASDREAVCYEGEIANLLEDTGFDVEIDNAERKPPEQKIPAGLEMTVADETIRPIHAYRIVRAFRSAGVAIATRIDAMGRRNDTLYITVGPNGAPAFANGQLKALATLLENWKTKFAPGLRRRKQVH